MVGGLRTREEEEGQEEKRGIKGVDERKGKGGRVLINKEAKKGCW